MMRSLYWLPMRFKVVFRIFDEKIWNIDQVFVGQVQKRCGSRQDQNARPEAEQDCASTALSISAVDHDSLHGIFVFLLLSRCRDEVS